MTKDLKGGQTCIQYLQLRAGVSEVEGDGHCLLQALEEAFWKDYDIPYPIPKIIQDVAQELVTNTKYTRYHTHELDQNEVFKQFTKNMTSKQGKMLAELYIPAIANACNIKVNIIQHFWVCVIL